MSGERGASGSERLRAALAKALREQAESERNAAAAPLAAPAGASPPWRLRLAPARPGALLVITICLLGSSALRVGDPEGAVLRGFGALARAAASSEAEPASAAPAPAGSVSEASAPAPLAGCAPGASLADADPLLAAIREREAELEARAEAIAGREQVLHVAEAKIEEQLLALEEAELRLSETLALADRAAEKDLLQLVAVYEAMNPKNAADIFDAMDVSFAAGFLARMRKESAAEVLSGMAPEKAYAVSVLIAGRNAAAPLE